MTTTRSDDRAAAFGRRQYNAVVERVVRVHEELMILRVRPDGGLPRFEAGQYTTLGLGPWEQRVDGVDISWDGTTTRLIRRAYSIGCPMLDEHGRLVRCEDLNYLEFYLTLVARPTDEPPPLTPRLFALQAGDRLHVGPHPHGHYTLAAVASADNVVFAATGTGETPHNAMLAELLSRPHAGRIACVTCVRWERDAAYRDVHERLTQRHSNYRYRLLTTREPENLDPAHPAFVGKLYLQDYFAAESFAKEFGWRPEPADTHVFLCGSPTMIGLPRQDADGHLVFDEPTGMVEVLTQAGFSLDEPHQPGKIHVEKYW